MNTPEPISDATTKALTAQQVREMFEAEDRARDNELERRLERERKS